MSSWPTPLNIIEVDTGPFQMSSWPTPLKIIEVDTGPFQMSNLQDFDAKMMFISEPEETIL
jgi:hypothetical protein